MSEENRETGPGSDERVQIKRKPDNSNLETLRTAFPTVDATVINAVLVASSNHMERAFDALLGMSDPDYMPEPTTRETSPEIDHSEEQKRQILADELFARQLANQSRRMPSQRAATSRSEEAEHSFIDDGLPILKENIIQGFNDTKVKVGSFISNLRAQYTQRVEGHNTADSPRNNFRQQQEPRTSTQYDHDALSLDDDFGELQLQDNTFQPNSPTVASEHSARPNPIKPVAAATSAQSLAADNPGVPAYGKAAQRVDSQPFSLGDDDEDD